MKKELNPVVVIVAIVVVLAGIVAAVVMNGNAGTQKVDVKKIDPADLRDAEPIKRGQPGYRERITDPPTQ